MSITYMKVSKILPLIAFILLLIIVIFNTTNNEYIVVENRYKTEFPKLRIKSLLDRTYQDGIESYFGDQIIAEKKLVEVKSQYEIIIGNDTIRNSVLIGDDMFFSETTLDDINGKLLTDTELKETMTYLEGIKDYYNSLGYEFYLAIGPNKASIYGERLSSMEVATYRAMDQLEELIITESAINYINLYDVIMANKNISEDQLYFSYDTHWNYLGGLIAADEILKEMYDETMLNSDAYKKSLVYKKASNSDLANIIGVGDLYVDMTYIPAEEVNYYKDFMDFSNDSDEELIVIRDSFFDGVAPVFEELEMSKKYVAFLSHNKEAYRPSKNKGKVLMLVVERNIYPSIKGAYDTIFDSNDEK